tara:strand:- start:602 stop:826 length:225 start_codon:yes stop_codon:yes gene_type:complete
MTYDVRADEIWKYSEPKMKLFEEALKILINYYGNGEEYPSKEIFECASEWIDKGQMTTSGLVKYYDAYYTGKCS